MIIFIHLAVRVIIPTESRSLIANIILRKYYHWLSLFMFLPAIYIHVYFFLLFSLFFFTILFSMSSFAPPLPFPVPVLLPPPFPLPSSSLLRYYRVNSCALRLEQV